MATIKSYTDISQSKKLAEILPLESADMHYWLAWRGDVPKEKRNTPKVGTPNKDSIKTYWCPCWSLAALLDILPNYEINNFGNNIQLDVNNEALITEDNETLLDLVVNMIIHLHKLKML